MRDEKQHGNTPEAWASIPVSLFFGVGRGMGCIHRFPGGGISGQETAVALLDIEILAGIVSIWALKECALFAMSLQRRHDHGLLYLHSL
jgi:hypothetical protein